MGELVTPLTLELQYTVVVHPSVLLLARSYKLVVPLVESVILIGDLACVSSVRYNIGPRAEYSLSFAWTPCRRFLFFLCFLFLHNFFNFFFELFLELVCDSAAVESCNDLGATVKD